jgi:undecaprenyl-diphosphatase
MSRVQVPSIAPFFPSQKTSISYDESMRLLEAILLGIVQGATEFFPISSSAHLQLARKVLGVEEPPVLFDLACHLGTLCALLLFFRKDLVALLRKRSSLIPLFLALLPLVPAYVLLKPVRELAAQPHLLGYFLLATGGILCLGRKTKAKERKSTMKDPLLIGSAQALALLPGISRSGSTIAAARLLGWQMEDAVRFSFLLSIPAIAGGLCLEGMKAVKKGMNIELLLPCLIGGVVAFCIGQAVIGLAMKWLKRGKLPVFSWYCMGLGALTLLASYLGFLK